MSDADIDKIRRKAHEAGREEVLTQFAMTLGWGNTPPIDMMLREIKILQERSRKLGVTPPP
jgi:hypothetical protein